MSYFQPRYVPMKKEWRMHRRSKRYHIRRQKANGGWIQKKELKANLWVQIQGSEKQRVHVYVDLETDSMKSAWSEARDHAVTDGGIGCSYEMFYKGYFRPRHSSLKMWGIKEDDVLTLVPLTDPSWIKFKKLHPQYYVTSLSSAAAYETWADQV